MLTIFILLMKLKRIEQYLNISILMRELLDMDINIYNPILYLFIGIMILLMLIIFMFMIKMNPIGPKVLPLFFMKELHFICIHQNL